MTGGVSIGSEMRGRVLFLSRAFPPAPWVAAVRTGNMALFLQKAGWQVDVVTLDASLLSESSHAGELARVQSAGVRIRPTGYRWALFSGAVRSPGGAARRLAARVAQALVQRLEIDDGFGWIRPAMEACRDLRPGDVSVVMASGSPFFSFGIARRLAARLRCPYVLDYRDLWNLSPHHKPCSLQRPLERRWARDAARLIFVSRGCLEPMARWLGMPGRMCVVSNGYDADEFAGIDAPRAERPVVVYAGRFYPPLRVLTPVLAAMQRLRPGSLCPDLHYYGPHGAMVEGEAGRFGVTERVRVFGQVSRRDVLVAIRRAWAAVVITTIEAEGSVADQGIVTAKVFEPIGLRTPVLLIAPRHSDARVIVEQADAGRSYTGDDTEGIAGFLTRIASGTERFGFAGADRFAWQDIGCGLSDILGEVVLEDRTARQARATAIRVRGGDAT